MKTSLTIILLTVLTFSAFSQTKFKIAEIYPVETSHSYIGFSIKYMGYAMVRGRFDNFDGCVRFDQNDVTKTSVSLWIDVSSLDTGNEWRDKDLISPNWFDATGFPKMYFISKKVEGSAGKMIATGDLTIRGITKTISIPLTMPAGEVKDVRGDSQIIFTGGFTVNRRDFGVEGKNWDGIKEGITAVSDDVTIELTILGKRINENNFRSWVNNINSPQGKIYKTVTSQNTDAGIKEFDTIIKDPEKKISEWTLDNVGQMLLKEKKVNDAIAIFRKNLLAFPDKSIVYESLAEALATQENWTEATRYYSIALEKDPDNFNAKEILRHAGK